MRAEAILKAVAWVEKVAEFQEEQRYTRPFCLGREGQDCGDFVRGGPLIKRAPRYPVYVWCCWRRWW